MSGDWISETSVLVARELWDQGVSAGEIAKRLGATKNAVSGYAHRHGWPMHGSRHERKPDTHGKGLGKKPRSHKAKVKRTAPPPPEPARLAVGRVVHRTCQYILGDDPRSWRVCGAPADPGISYCTAHARICFVQRRQLEVAA